jgi:response regulator RpfG family c-di-GMP phosphodiesterase
MPVKRTETGLKRASIHYIWTVLVLSIYGGQVCPYIEGLGIAYWLVILGVFFSMALAARQVLINKLVLTARYENMVSRQFYVEASVFLLTSILISAFNMVMFDFPLESGLKIILGIITLGFFESIDLALKRERIIADHFKKTGEHMPVRDKTFSLTKKFLIVSIANVVLITTVIFLVISKDLKWLNEIGQMYPLKARLAVFAELAFIAGVIILELVNVIISYSKNLSIFFENENSALKAVANGDFSAQATVSTNDEFGEMAHYTNRMIGDLKNIISELKNTQDATILSLASLAEIRDMETGLHIIRTKLYVKALAIKLSGHPDFKDFLDPETIELLHKSAPLHDIGKVGIPDSVLLKPARLTKEEFEIMKQHPVMGGDALGEAEKVLGDSSFLLLAREIAYNHHEKWDGSGYPKGLKENDIPLSGRLMALADVYDALVFKRVYKPAIPHEETKQIILKDRGRHFDPQVVDAFIEIEDEFREIAHQYREETNTV